MTRRKAPFYWAALILPDEDAPYGMLHAVIFLRRN